MPAPPQLFGRIALKKGYLDESKLSRALRIQEELSNLGLRKQLGGILLALGSMQPDQIEKVLRLQALNERAVYARRYGRIALKNDLINQLQFDVAFERAEGESFQRSLSSVLQELGYLDSRHARAITVALDRVLARNMGRDEPTGRTTARLSQALSLEGEEDELALETQRRVRDLTFAAVALREGMVLIPELERAVEEQLRRDEPPPLEDLLRERGVLGQPELDAVERALKVAQNDKLTIPGYELLDVLGYGVTSLVLRARHQVLERDVALKLFHAEHAAAAGAEALAEEARVVAAIEHPNVVGIYEVGRVHRRVYYVMELVDGANLHEAIRDEGAFSEERTLRLARDLLAGLVAIHDHGVVHRDVKPLNVLLTPDGTAKLTDLGLACEDGIDASGALYGSPLTMSPEQAQGERVDVRADLYGLGATLYNAVTGAPPYQGENAMAIMMDHISAPVPDPRGLRPELSQPLAEWIVGLLAKSPDERPPSAQSALDALNAKLA